MITLLILILLAITGVLLYFHQNKKYGMIFFLLTLIIYLDVGLGWFPKLLFKNLQSPYQTLNEPHFGKKNAIIVLGAGEVKSTWMPIPYPSIISYSRIYEAARLYRLCKKSGNVCTILLSGGDVSHTGRSEAELMQHHLTDLGIENTDMIVESKSLNTFQNARYSSLLLKSGKYDQMFLVTSALHMRRALLYFSHFGIISTPTPADYLDTIRMGIPTGYNFAMADLVLHEYIGILRYNIYNFLGWNSPTP